MRIYGLSFCRPGAFRVLCLFATLLVLDVSAGAQTYVGGLRGTVRDSAGGVVPDTQLVLMNEETNASRTSTSNAAGEYAFANVPPGTYMLTATKAGFKKFERKDIRIGTQAFITLDLTVDVGQVTEVVMVTGAAPALENSNASVGTTLEKKELETLPTPARNIFFLSVATANVVPTGDPQFVRQQDQTNSSLLNLGGGARRANNYTVDGVPITDMRNRAVFIPNIESVEDVKVQVSTYDAEMGRTGGGVFNTTSKSGGNVWHGSGMYQNRPSGAKAKLFFDTTTPETYYHLYSGSLGGPVIRDRTFFWGTVEGYKTKTPRSARLTLPTEAQLQGDFTGGRTIYDPLTTRLNPNFNSGQAESATNPRYIRDAFPNNRIPAPRINNVASALRQYWPKPDSGNTANRTAALIDVAYQWTAKGDHRFSDKLSTSGLYAFYDSQEPEARFYAKNPGENPGDPGEGALFRTVHMVAINNTWSVSSHTVASFRYGFTQFIDDDIPITFDPASLGFSQAFLSAIPYKKFPRFAVAGYGSANFDTFGDRAPTDTTYYSHGVNASVSRLIGRHTVKLGGDWRVIGMKLLASGQSSGSFSFNTGFTQGPGPLTPAANTGDSLASFLLGFPASGNIPVATPGNFYINYYAGYVHDDFRMTPKLTLNLGMRYEYEQGLQERNNRITVGFDRNRTFPVQVAGLNLRGGLMYAGVDGYPTHQSDPSTTKFAPRAGFAWSVTPKTVLRGGYGIFYSPNQYAFPNENRLGTRGFTAITDYVASTDGGLTPCAGCSLTNPFPSGVEQPVGSRLGLLTGTGGTVHFIDQFRKSAYVQQYSLDVQREWRQFVFTAGYVGSHSVKLSVGGTNSNTVNINQLPSSLLSQGAALLTQVPNPMFGNTAFGQFGRQQTIARGQLLRPYPQFGDVLAHQVSAGSARYNSLVLKFQKRLSNGWGAHINYTYSVNKDNLFGEANYFASNVASALDNHNLRLEYGHSLLDAPHRLNIAPIYELPWGKGRRWLDRGGMTDVLFGGWSVAAVGSYQSGFPSAVVQDTNNTGLLGGQQRPNLVSGQDPKTSGGTEDRLNGWFNVGAWSQASAFTLGNAPRTDTRVRTPLKINTDISFQKVQRLTERTSMVVRFELINAFNDANFLGPATRFGRADFGRITQVGGFPRLLQWSARAQW
jgi:hypothetical protein